MGALRTTHLTIRQVSCLIYRIHIGARYFTAIIAKCGAAISTTAHIFTPPIGRILFGQWQRWCRKELGGEQSRRGIQPTLMVVLLLMMIVVWLMRGHYGLVWYGSKL